MFILKLPFKQRWNSVSSHPCFPRSRTEVFQHQYVLKWVHASSAEKSSSEYAYVRMLTIRLNLTIWPEAIDIQRSAQLISFTLKNNIYSQKYNRKLFNVILVLTSENAPRMKHSEMAECTKPKIANLVSPYVARLQVPSSTVQADGSCSP